MSPELKQNWVTALRSGKYNQAQECLNNGEGGYCCLGVLCDIINPAGWRGFGDMGLMWEKNPGIFEERFVHGDVELPTELLEELDMSLATQSLLIEMNDTRGATFEEIASYIEENL